MPTSLLTAMTDTTRTDGSRASAQPVEVDSAGCVDRHHPAADVLDRVQHGVVLGRRTDRHAAVATDRPEHGEVVGLGAASREHDLAWPHSRARRRRRRGPRRAALRASREAACEPLGLANRSVRNGSIALTASGRIGVVAAWSR